VHLARGGRRYRRGRVQEATDRADQPAQRLAVDVVGPSEAVDDPGRGTPLTGSRSFCAHARYDTALQSAFRRLVSRKYMHLHDAASPDSHKRRKAKRVPTQFGFRREDHP
jgi:hypothetical protein